MADNEYLAEYAKQGRAKCKHSGCKINIEKDTARLGKSHPSGFHDGNQVDWYHPKCLFKAFCNAKKGSKLVEDVDDIKGFLMLKKEDKDDIIKHFNDFQSGKLKKEVLEEKKKKREENKKEKEMLDKMLGKSGVGSPKKGAATKKNTTPKKGNKSGPKFIEGLIDSNEEEDQSNDSIDIQPSNKNSEASPSKKFQSNQSKPSPLTSSNSPKKPSNIPEEKLFGAWSRAYTSLTSRLSGFNLFSQSHKESLNLFSIKQTPRVLCIGLSPYHDPLIKYDKATAYNNLLQSISPQSNFSVFKWFTALKERQQFLFLHSPTGEPTFDCYWVPLLIKTIKMILKSAEQDKQGVVFALFGSEAHKISPIILHFFKHDYQHANFRLLQFPDLSQPLVKNNNEKIEDNNNLSLINFNKAISGAALEMGLPTIRWYTKKEYALVIKGDIEGNPINHILTQNTNLGRVSFEHQLLDKRISRDQVKAELIEGEESSPSSMQLRITVLGRNPIEVQHEKEERKTLKQGESDILKSGENFNLILGANFFQIALAEIAEDGSVLDSKGNKKESPADTKKSFSRAIENGDTQSYSPTLQRSNSSDLKIQPPSPKSGSPQNKRKRTNETELGRETRKKGKTINYKEIGSEDDLEAEEDIDEDEDEALARKLQKEYEKENDNFKKQKSGKRGSDKRKLRNRTNIVLEDSSEEDGKRIKAEIADGGPDSPYEDDDLWAQEKKFKYKSEDEEISSSDEDDGDDEDDDLDIPTKKIPCKWGAACYRKNPDHLREFSHPK
jgi:hypothetical protein